MRSIDVHCEVWSDASTNRNSLEIAPVFGCLAELVAFLTRAGKCSAQWRIQNSGKAANPVKFWYHSSLLSV